MYYFKTLTIKTIPILLLTLFISNPKITAQKPIIFDNDFGCDADDLIAMVMLHNFEGKGLCDIKAFVCSSSDFNTTSAIDAVNKFYGRDNIPIAVDVTFDSPYEYNYSKSLSEHFNTKNSVTENPFPTRTYRGLLAAQPDRSVTIIVCGPLNNIYNLLKSSADQVSPLTGKELFNKKVDELIIAGGGFPQSDDEYCFTMSGLGVAKYVTSAVKVPITFIGKELYNSILFGDVINDINPLTPLYEGLLLNCSKSKKYKGMYRDKIFSTQTAAEIAVLYALDLHSDSYWRKITGIKCIPDKTGGNTIKPDSKSQQSYLELFTDKENIKLEIEKSVFNIED